MCNLCELFKVKKKIYFVTCLGKTDEQMAALANRINDDQSLINSEVGIVLVSKDIEVIDIENLNLLVEKLKTEHGVKIRLPKVPDYAR